jgi:hypothetical protein
MHGKPIIKVHKDAEVIWWRKGVDYVGRLQGFRTKAAEGERMVLYILLVSVTSASICTDFSHPEQGGSTFSRNISSYLSSYLA